ncbi:MAG: phosphatase PAP2 family protein [Candidatus Aminicenantaceae bacterium]
MAKGGTALDGTFIYFIAYATVTNYKRKPIHASDLKEIFDEKSKYFFRFFSYHIYRNSYNFPRACSAENGFFFLMFQSEIILFIQSFSTDALTFFFKFWTTLGYPAYVMAFLIIIMFGVRFREGFILIHAVLWTTIATLTLKNLFALPRPTYVDRNVQLLGENHPNTTPFENMGAKFFFGHLPHEVIEAFRDNPFDSWGLPSGHTSNATSSWGLLMLRFQKRWLFFIAIAMIVFIPFSRMYLGRHFLADILGGYLVGGIMLFVFYHFVFQNSWIMGIFDIQSTQIPGRGKTIILLGYLFFLPLGLLLIPTFPSNFLAILIGANVGFLIVWRRGIPKDFGSFLQRTVRVLIAFGVCVGVDRGLEAFHSLIFQSESTALSSLRMGISTFFLIWGATELNIKLRLFKRVI